MPEYSLRQGASVAFPSGPLTIRAIPGLRIDVRARLDATVRTASRQPDLVVVPQLTGPCDVYLSRVDQASFTGAEQAVQQWAQRPTARSGSSAASRAPAEGFLTYLVSDAVPVDHDPQQDQRVVVLCRPGAWSLLDDGRTDKAIPIPVPVGTDLAESLAGDQRLLQEVVGRIADPLLTRGGAR